MLTCAGAAGKNYDYNGTSQTCPNLKTTRAHCLGPSWKGLYIPHLSKQSKSAKKQTFRRPWSTPRGLPLIHPSHVTCVSPRSVHQNFEVPTPTSSGLKVEQPHRQTYISTCIQGLFIRKIKFQVVFLYCKIRGSFPRSLGDTPNQILPCLLNNFPLHSVYMAYLEDITKFNVNPLVSGTCSSHLEKLFRFLCHSPPLIVGHLSMA